MSKLNDTANDILRQIDIAAEYRSWGLEITQQTPGPKGWLECRSFGGQDRNPSAGINVSGEDKDLGRYKEFSGEGRNLSFWDAAATFGGFADWRAARKHYAESAGVSLKDQKDEPFLREVAWIDLPAQRFVHGMAGVSWKSLRPTGAVMAKRGGLRVIAWPVFAEGWEPVGHYYKNILPGGTIKQGKAVHKQLLTPGCSPCGWIGADALQRIAAGQVRRVLWVEGVPDMLAAETARMAEDIADVAILTSSHGALSVPPNAVLARLTDIPTWVIGDADKDGQAGVVRKLHHLRHYCPHGRWDLPYEVEEKHGKDLRDWLNEGHNLAEILEGLPEPVGRDISSPPASADQPREEKIDSAEEERAAEILRKLNLHIAGRTGKGQVEIWNGAYSRWEETKNLDSWKIDSFLLMTGAKGDELVCSRQTEDDDRMPWSTLRRYIAMSAAEASILDDNRYGPGVWLSRDLRGVLTQELVIVDRDWAGVWDGRELIRLSTPFHRAMILRIGVGEAAWIDYEHLKSLLVQAEDPDWCRGTVEAVAEIFRGWQWGNQSSDPYLLTALLMSTFLQNANAWCPHVCILGGSNTGKTMLMNTLEALFTPLAFRSEDSTYRGVRYAISGRSRPTLLDEWDTTRQRDEFLKMFRSANRGSKRATATAGQEFRETIIKASFFVAGIHTGLHEAADRNRFIMLELMPPAEDMMGKLSPPPADVLYTLGTELLAIAIRRLPEALLASRNARGARMAYLPDPRQIESYATPGGFLAASMGMDPCEAFDLVSRSCSREEIESDEDNLIADIFGLEVDAGIRLRRRSIGQLVALLIRARSIEGEYSEHIDEIESTLERNGIVFRDFEHVGWICFHAESLHRIGRLPAWKGKTLQELFKRLPGGEIKRLRTTIGQRRWWCYPEEVFLESHGISIPTNLF